MSMLASARTALIAALRDDAALGALVHHIDDGEAKLLSPPYGRIAETSASEWGAKDKPGHELRIELLFADRGDGARLNEIGTAAYRVIAAMPRTIDGWETSGFAVLRTRQARTRNGLNQVTISLRVRGWKAV